MQLLFLLALIISLFSTPVVAADINLTLHQQSIDDNVSVIVENNSGQGVVAETVYIELDGQRYEHSAKEIIPANNRKDFHFKVRYPSLHGSYPLIVTVRYLNDGRLLSIRHAGIFNFREHVKSDTSCTVENNTVRNEGDILLATHDPAGWRLIVPEEIEVLSSVTLSDQKIFHVKSRVAGFRNAYPVFAVSESIADGRHSTGMCSGMLTVDTMGPLNKGRLQSGVLMMMAAGFMIATFFLLNCKLLNCKISLNPPLSKGESDTGRFFAALCKYTSRMFFITISYFFLKNIDSWLDGSLAFIDLKPYQYLVDIAVANFNGGNYRHFFDKFIDVYLAACLFLAFPYFYCLDSKTHISDDKYISLCKTIFSLPAFLSGKGIYWNKVSRLSLLTILVKLFFIPYMVSWSVSGVYNLKNIYSGLQWNIYSVNTLLVELFMLLDTTIFAVGYIAESKFLRSDIKSVEPTFLGWLVCLWCYPPFNAFSFKPFDYPVADISIDSPQWVHAAMTCVITILWGIFAWASVALGFKASNLTNRGIIKTGPYRYVRHPAYVAKLLIWIIQGIFFSQYGPGILMGFTLIYVLRAWTEERHLSSDADYIEYKKSVKWRFIPGLI